MFGLLFCNFVKPSTNFFGVGGFFHSYFALISCLLHVSRAWQMKGNEGYCFCLAFVAYFSLLPLCVFPFVPCADVTPTDACKTALVGTCVTNCKNRVFCPRYFKFSVGS